MLVILINNVSPLQGPIFGNFYATPKVNMVVCRFLLKPELSSMIYEQWL